MSKLTEILVTYLLLILFGTTARTQGMQTSIGGVWTRYFPHMGRNLFVGTRGHSPHLFGDGVIDRILFEMRGTSIASQLQEHNFLEWRRDKRAYFIDGRESTLALKLLSPNGWLMADYLSQRWNGGEWVNYSKVAYTYGGDRNIVEIFGQKWIDSTWENYSNYTYTYDGNGNKTVQLIQMWIDSTWKNNTKDTTSYDGNGKITEDVSQDWNGSEWVNQYKYAYTYDENGNAAEVVIQSWNDSVWVNLYKTTNTYDGNANQTEALDQTWQDSTWKNHYKHIYTYDETGNITEYQQQAWNGSAWENYYEDTFTYDGNGNLTGILYQNWNSDTWVNASKDLRSYDGNRNMTEYLYQNWNGNTWQNFSKTAYTWLEVTSVDDPMEPEVTFSLSSNYPNPFNPNTTFKFHLSAAGNVSLKIFDVLGRLVATIIEGSQFAGEHEVSWSANDLPGGVYFYRLQMKGFVETRKMILMK
jgi:hypothetical protein